jgi:rRNA processing protein Krr1/Pno1
MEMLDKILEILQANEAVTIMVGGFTVELAMRLMKTKFPLGMLHIASKVVAKSAAILAKLAELSDKVLPQVVGE